MTPEEAWSGVKPSVQHFRIFCCIAYCHVPDTQRKKLDDKSSRCILLGIGEESKASKIYDPKSKKVVISRDVIFEESQGSNWNATTNSKTSKLLVDDDVFEFTSDTPVNEIDPDIPDLEDISENASSNHEEEMDLDSFDDSKLPRSYLDDYVTGEEVEEEQ